MQREQASKILTHAKLLTEHDERMERVGRHLEVLIAPAVQSVNSSHCSESRPSSVSAHV
jgi:hypothetical protein